MNKRRRRKAAAKRDAQKDAETNAAMAVLGGQPHRPKRRPRLTWREKLLTDTIDPRGPKGSR